LTQRFGSGVFVDGNSFHRQVFLARIVGRWLRSETYDQIARATHHSIVSLQRYVQMFSRVIHLHQQGLSPDEIALLLQVGWPLVAEYLAIHEKHDTPFVQERLKTQLQRFQRRTQDEKKRVA